MSMDTCIQTSKLQLQISHALLQLEHCSLMVTWPILPELIPVTFCSMKFMDKVYFKQPDHNSLNFKFYDIFKPFPCRFRSKSKTKVKLLLEWVSKNESDLQISVLKLHCRGLIHVTTTKLKSSVSQVQKPHYKNQGLGKINTKK